MHHLCWTDESTGWLPRIERADDPVLLGVHAAVSSEHATSRTTGTGTPAYVPRDVDNRLDAVLRDNGFALLVGDSTSGKSRAAYEAMRRLPHDRWLLVPRDGRALRGLIDDGLPVSDTVIWLDDLERFLGPGGLDAALLQRLRGDGTNPACLLATMRASEYFARLPDETRPAAKSSVLEADQEVLLAAERVTVSRLLSETEQRHAMSMGFDDRIADAIRHRDDFGFGEYLTAGPRLWRRWRGAASNSSPIEARVGAAAVAAAVDCRRAGHFRPVDTETLRELAPLYLTNIEIDPARFQAGLEWAAQSEGMATGLLRHHPEGWIAFDYLLDRTQLDEQAPSVPGPVWQRLVRDAGLDEAWSIGMAAYWSGRLDFAERAFRLSLNAADPTVVARATLGLSEVANLLDKFAEARRWLGLSADSAGDEADSLTAMQNRDDLATSERWYRHVAGVDQMAVSAQGDTRPEVAGHLLVEHEHAALDYRGGEYVQHTRRRLRNLSHRTIDRYPIRIAVERFPDDAERSRRHYRRHPLRVEDLRLWAECNGHPMAWEVSQDFDDFKEIWLIFANENRTFPLTPGSSVELRYGYTVSDQQWGPWSQRPVRVPTRRLDVRFSFPATLRVQLVGSETALKRGATPLAVAEQWQDDLSVFTWETNNPPLNSRYRFDWSFNRTPAAPAPEPARRSCGGYLDSLDSAQLPDLLRPGVLNELVERFCALGAALSGKQATVRADPAMLPGLEWQLEQDMLAAVRDTLGPVPVLAEEYFHRFGTAVDSDRQADVRLVLDPLDGSYSFLRGEPTYACTFAVWVNNRLTFGLVYQPTEDRAYWAVRGQQSYVDGRQLRSSPQPGRRTVAIKSTVEKVPYVVSVREMLDSRGYSFEHVESSALKLCWIAEGRRAGMIKRVAASGGTLLEWGVAAGMLIGHQAGCQIRSWSGEDWRPGPGGLLVGDALFVQDAGL